MDEESLGNGSRRCCFDSGVAGNALKVAVAPCHVDL